jgi:hypothetical protein
MKSARPTAGWRAPVTRHQHRAQRRGALQELNEAYAILADPAKRKVYDSLTFASEPVAPPPETHQTPPPLRPTAAMPTAPRAAQPTMGRRESSRTPRPFPPTWAVLLILIGLCIILGVSAAALRTFLPLNRPASGAEAVKVNKLITFDTPPPVSSQESVIQESGTPLLTVLPSQLEVGGQSLGVVPVTPEQGRWPVPSPDRAADVAVWIHGTASITSSGCPTRAPRNPCWPACLAQSDHVDVGQWRQAHFRDAPSAADSHG